LESFVRAAAAGRHDLALEALAQISRDGWLEPTPTPMRACECVRQSPQPLALPPPKEAVTRNVLTCVK
jgi:hypothetical protein